MRRRRKERQEKTGDQFQKGACCSSTFVQGAAGKKMVGAKRVLGVTGILGKANSHFDPTDIGSVAAPSR